MAIRYAHDSALINKQALPLLKLVGWLVTHGLQHIIVYVHVQSQWHLLWQPLVCPDPLENGALSGYTKNLQWQWHVRNKVLCTGDRAVPQACSSEPGHSSGLEHV